MDHGSLTQYIGKKVKLVLDNGFWYKAKILDVNEDSVTFIELKGNTVSVHPSVIMVIEEVSE
ncbi:hypothetical protein LCGC14_0476320 [marine sediment metagenome]|uniref:Tudor domain-containing protein n=1 Tax=marine sediment metagenome TaxID=412755 RepID=A0A0F9SFW6_9ZZZZ|nr:hypothetical protein [bacterium]